MERGGRHPNLSEKSDAYLKKKEKRYKRKRKENWIISVRVAFEAFKFNN